MIRYCSQWLAHRQLRRAQAQLQRVTDQRRNSFAVIDYRRRREAALKHTPKVWA